MELEESIGMRILGIDPGLATIGIGVIDSSSPYDLQCKEWLTLRTKPGKSLPDRLREIHEDLAGYVREARPDLAVVEKLYFAKNETTAIDVAQARGCILLVLSEQGIPLLEPTPMQLKSGITGDGKAVKSQMQDMVVRLLHLSEIPKPDDAADALALAVYGALRGRELTMTLA
jgi:crossover junction endodeoxyribonuclease RuvC